jgi:iron-sulfur cluster assembly protein
MIHLTPAAAQEINRILALQHKSTLRLSLAPSDCEQFYYRLEAVEPGVAGHRLVEADGVSLAIDSRHSQYLQDLHIDFAQDLLGGGFLFQNPIAAKVCRCGNAFTAQNGGLASTFEI